MRKIIGFGLCAGALFSTLTLSAAAGIDMRIADAAMRSERDTVRTLIQQKVDVNAPQPDGSTALHWAVQHDDLETAQLLLRSGAKANAASRYGVTPLYLACVSGNTAMIDALLKAGADAKSANPGGETALMTASRTGKLDAVKLLLDRGADPNAKEKVRGQTALMWAVIENHSDVAKLLVERGADINAQSDVVVPDGTTGQPGPQTSANIGAAGAGIDRSRAVPSPSGAMTGLLFAARDGNLGMARLLVDLKADLEKPAANGTTALIDAIANNHIELAMYLLDKGANPNAADNFYKRTPLYAAIEARNLDYARDSAPVMADARDPLDLIKALLAKGANPNTRANTIPVRGFMQVSANWANFDGQTPFLRAALAGDITVMRLLLEHGADPNINTNEGSTPLMAAAGINWVIAQTYSHSDAEYLEAAKLCIAKGNDVNAANGQGFTAMIGAANRGFDAMIQLLADNGAKLDAKDKQGRTPMDYAKGVFLAVNPAVNKPTTIALLEKLMGAPNAK